MTDLNDIDTSGARLPSTYNAARRAISQCASIDECKEWSDKAAALASYAKQAKDDQLEKMASRIRARATRRAGELLKQIEPGINRHTNSRGEGTRPSSRKQAAADAGLSEFQAKTAQRLANVPEDAFEDMVERGATVTEIAKAGTQPVEQPRDRAAAKALVAAVHAYADKVTELDLDAAIGALSSVQKAELHMLISRLDTIHDKIATSI